MLARFQERSAPDQVDWSMAQQQRNALEKVLYWLGCSAVTAYARLMLDMDVRWRAPLPAGPKIVAANHPTTTDPFLILALAPEQISILISDTLFRVPVFGRYLRRAGHVPVIPGNGQAALEEGRRLLEAGRTVAIFPEGRISPLGGGFHPPHTGVARLALLTGAPVIPVGIHLERKYVRLMRTQVAGKTEVGTWYLQGPYAMTVGEALYFEGNVEDRAHVRAISEQVMRGIIHLTRHSIRRMEGPPAGLTRGMDKAVWLCR